MATLFVTEYAQVGVDGIPVEPANTTQTVTIAASSTQSSAFAANTNFIRLSTDTATGIAVGSNPTATTNTGRMTSTAVERILRVAPGHKIATFA